MFKIIRNIFNAIGDFLERFLIKATHYIESFDTSYVEEINMEKDKLIKQTIQMINAGDLKTDMNFIKTVNAIQRRHRIGLVRAANIIIDLNKSGLLNNADWKQKAARYHFKF
ncbi:hypothetical protein [Leuconostoc gasicomitatum]|uniref:hypothetical protein n=1 Tax=Leuconostoc gasicomitatum TaxID=115778 RepID=UPI000760B7FC|nr:hypothetical protein [Leuconostoc gasicomitatum]